jgi:hypothetical protein
MATEHGVLAFFRSDYRYPIVRHPRRPESAKPGRVTSRGSVPIPLTV